MSHYLELCLKSVQEAIKTINAEIIVVDNNSSDDSCHMVKKLFPNVRLISNMNNFGFSKGNNQGVKVAQGDYICILNPDTVVAEDTFVKILKFADSNLNIGIIGCKLIDGSGEYLPESKRNLPTPLVSIKKILGNSKSYYANHLNANETGKVDVLVGAFMLMKRDVYNKVDGFDEDYFMYGEDIDLSYKVLNSGYNNYYFGEASILHFKGESSLKDRTYSKHFYNAMIIFYKKHFRKNILFDTIAVIFLMFPRFIKSAPKIKPKKIERYVLISNKRWDKLSAKLNKPTTWNIAAHDFKNYTEIIFDANYLSYKNIIEQMMILRKNRSVTFKILPKSSNFILGSDSSKKSGEVINF